MDRPEIMSRIKSKNTPIEMRIRKELFKRGHRYRIHDKTVFGKPDIVFKKLKIAIFCDSAFWHGKKFLEGERFKTNIDFWETKIKRNIERDEEVNKRLKSEGWTVLRFWDFDIKKRLDFCIDAIEEIVKISK